MTDSTAEAASHELKDPMFEEIDALFDSRQAGREAVERRREPFIRAAQQGWPTKIPPIPPERHDEAREIASSLTRLKPWLHRETDAPPSDIGRWERVLGYTQETSDLVEGFQGLLEAKPRKFGFEHHALRDWLSKHGEPASDREQREARELEAEQDRARDQAKRDEERSRQEAMRYFVPDYDDARAMLLDARRSDRWPDDFDMQFINEAAQVLSDESVLKGLTERSRESIAKSVESPDPDFVVGLANWLAKKIGFFERGNIASLIGSSDEMPYEWLVEGLFERGDRLILTGEQGAGKSHLGAQICYDLARGVHPLDGSELGAPLRTLFIDMEIGKNAFGRILGLLKPAGGHDERVFVNMLHIDASSGFEILDDHDPTIAKIEERIETFRPDFVWVGGLYKTTQANLGDSGEGARACRAFQSWVDGWRTASPPEHRPVVCIEAHAGNKGKRPIGSSFWLNWPEFGLYLSNAGKLSHWRRLRDVSRSFPGSLARVDNRWAIKRSVHDDCYALVASVGELTIRELEERTGHSRSTIQRNFTKDDQSRALDEFEALDQDE